MKAEYSIWGKLDRGGLPLLVARLLLGGLFVYLGALKLGEPFEFLKQIRLFKMLPESPPIFLNGVAILLPWLEILSGAALLLGTRIRAAAALIAVMLAVFTPAILIRALNMCAETGLSFFKIEFDCGCGTGPVIIWRKLLANTGLFALAVYAVLSQARRFTGSVPVAPPPQPEPVKNPAPREANRLAPNPSNAPNYSPL